MSERKGGPGKQAQEITPPSSFVHPPPTPPPTDEKPSGQIQRVLKRFRECEVGTYVEQNPWACFQLAPEAYEELQRQVEQDEVLSGYVKHKLRYDYDPERSQLVIRMIGPIHDRFMGSIVADILRQLTVIQNGSDNAAAFAKGIEASGSTSVYFAADDDRITTKCKHDPDASFEHDEAQYPGVVFEVAYSQKGKDLYRLAEDYLLGSDTNIQVVVGFDIEYKSKAARKATLSVWRTNLFHTDNGDEVRVVSEVLEEPFRDDQGNPTSYSGLRLELRDFANKGLVKSQLGDDSREITITTEQLCRYLARAEAKILNANALSKDTPPPGALKRRRSETPPEQVTASDETEFRRLERRVARRVEAEDPDYQP